MPIINSDNWEQVILRDICDVIQYGYTASAESHPTGPKFLRITDIVPNVIDWERVPYCQIDNDKMSRYLLHDNDIVIARTGATSGYAKLIKHPPLAVFASYLVRLHMTSGVDSRFIGAVIESPSYKQFIMTNIGGAAQPNANAQVLTSFPILLPPLPIQRKIASILSAYDDLIENNLRRIAILEEVARLLYREWFVNFRFPGHKSVPFVNSTLGPIPEGWEAKRLGDVVELAYGKGLKADHRIDGPVPVYGSGGIIGYHNESMVKGPGIIVGRKGNVGSVFWSYEDFFPIDTVFFVQTQTCLHYVYYNLQTQNFINNDAAVPGLSRNQAYLLPFLLPDKKTLDSFQHLTDTFFRQIRNLESRNTNLRATRDLLLPRLISGDLDISDLSIVTGEELDLELQPVQSRLF